jgi:membrane-associated phospholipid phosphatase
MLTGRFLMLKNILPILLCLVTATVFGQNSVTARGSVTDTTKKDFSTTPDTIKRQHNALSYILPAAAIGYGVSSFIFQPVRRVDYYFYGVTQRSDPNFHTNAESYLEFGPIAMVYGLNLVGIEGKDRFIDRTALLALSGGIFGVTGYVTKYATHRLRPDGSDDLSFPSAHTATAFLGAEFLAEEYSDQSPVYTVVGYTMAVTTGVLRIYNRDHWFSDVVAGAGFGILSTKAAYLVYPHIRNWLTHQNKKGKNTMLMPTYQDGTFGLAFAKEL